MHVRLSPLLLLLLVQCRATTDRRDQLVLMSYNVMFVPKYLVAERDQMTRAHLLAKAKFLRSSDILCLQEVFQPEPTEILLDALTSTYPYRTPILGDDEEKNLWDETWNHQIQRSTWKFLSGGLTIMSQWPIIYAVQYFFEHSCSGHRFVRVGFIYAKVLFGEEEYPIHVIGTHLQPDDAPGCYPTDQRRIREKQMREIRHFLDQRRIPSDEYLFLLGDFNVDRYNEDPYQSMLDLLQVQPQLLHPSSIPCTWDSSYNAMTHSKHRENQLLDYIFISSNHSSNNASWMNLILDRLASEQWHLLGRDRMFFNTRNIPLMELSDHYPVLGFFDVSEKTWPNRSVGVITYVRFVVDQTNEPIVLVNRSFIIGNSSEENGTLFILTNNGTPRRSRCLRSEQYILLIDAYRPMYFLSDAKSLRMKHGMEQMNRYVKILQLDQRSKCLETNSTFLLQSQLRTGFFFVSRNASRLCFCTEKKDEALPLRLIEVKRSEAICRRTD